MRVSSLCKVVTAHLQDMFISLFLTQPACISVVNCTVVASVFYRHGLGIQTSHSQTLTNGSTHQFDKEKETGVPHPLHLSCGQLYSVRNFGLCQEKETGMPLALHLSCVLCQLNKSTYTEHSTYSYRNQWHAYALMHFNVTNQACRIQKLLPKYVHS